MKDNIFIAINPPKVIKQELGLLIEKASKIEPGFNWINPDNLHLTLIFLGQFSDDLIAKITATTKYVTKKQKPFWVDLSLPEIIKFKDSGLFWLRNSGSLSLFELRKNIIYQLAIGGFNFENKQFVPHFTLARYKKDSKNLEKLKKIFTEIKNKSFTVASIDIMQAENKNNSFFYRRIFRVPFGKTN